MYFCLSVDGKGGEYGLGNGVTNEHIDTIDTNYDINQRDISNEKQLLQLLEQNPKITQKQIQTKLNLSLSTVKRLMAELQVKGLIVRIGNNRSGEWHLNKHDK